MSGKITSRAVAPVIHKMKKSYTLSHESVLFLENVSRKRRGASVSSVLDEMIQGVRHEQERQSLGQAVDAYYSGLAGDEAQELEEWGDFAMSQFPSEVEK